VDVIFKRTGERRYAVVVLVPGKPVQAVDPAPGYDDDIPHDLVHYVVEAELRLMSGVFGRAANGGGTFVAAAAHHLSTRERARQRRKQERREGSLGARDSERGQELATSERLAALCDVAWRRRHGQRPDPLRKAPEPLATDDRAAVARVVARLDELAPLWRALAIGEELAFEWPASSPRQASC
jgi:hypothetical protein